QRYRRSHFKASREECRAKAEIQAMLAEKESLLHEVHHRVKNNLQVISSLMALQAASLEDARAHELFCENQERLRSIALIHEKLYRTEEFAALDFDDFLKDLSGPLLKLFAAGKSVEIRTEAGGIRLPIEVATPCALIVNELITNALKYAFAGRDKGTVSVSLETRDAAPKREYRLRVSDDGVGLAPGFDWRCSKSLGLRLVDILAKQMKGTAEATTGNGTTFTVRFAMPFAGEAVR
ncbi:MAG: sensor histidine kinase, partial [Candidatus Aminicenantales bacterium]